MRVDRRTTLKWMAAAMAAANAGCGPDRGDGVPPTGRLLGTPRPVDGAGYGVDPDVVSPAVPWSLTMTTPQLDVATVLCDMILPADERSPSASEVGVADFVDEWISAPYPRQRDDREVILDGLEWLEAESRARYDTGFALATAADRSFLVDGLAWPGRGAATTERLQDFFRRFRFLAVGAYYSTEAGMKEAGYTGNVAITGEYPGPSDEAMAHLESVLDKLGLTLEG